MELKSLVILSLLSIVLARSTSVNSCRLNSEQLKGYARKTVESLLSSDQFGSLYWPDEPLPADSLSRAIGINVTIAETHFQIEHPVDQENYDKQNNEPDGANSTSPQELQDNGSSPAVSLIQDIFVTCSIDRDRSYTLSINLELDNPFKVVDIYYESQGSLTRKSPGNESNHERSSGLFRIHLPQSSLLVQLSQRIRYDGCLTVNYVQLSPTVNYEIDCSQCGKSDREFLDKIFSKRMSQLDAELDAIVSEKVLYGLQVLLSQQRLDLDMYMD